MTLVPTLTELRGKRVVVVGLGLSGVAASRLLLASGARLVATDSKSRDSISDDVRDLEKAGATLVLGDQLHAGARIPEADLVVVSPGVPSFPDL